VPLQFCWCSLVLCDNVFFCHLSSKMNIVKEEAKHERMRREELELKVQNIRQQKLIVPSFGNASCSMEDEMVNLVNSIRFAWFEYPAQAGATCTGLPFIYLYL
jgi:hypothetical protein